MNKYIKQWCFAVFMLSLSSVALAAPKGMLIMAYFTVRLISRDILLPNENKVGKRHLTPL